MGFMPVPSSGGDFKTYVTYNAKAGRWYTKPDGKDADLFEVTDMTALFDMASLTTGWFRFSAGAAPEKVMDPSFSESAPNPGAEFKRGFQIDLYSEKNLLGLREFSSTAGIVIEAMILRVFRHRGFSVSLTVLSLAFAGYFAGFVIVPQWQQAWLGFPATSAGLSSSFSATGALFTAPLAAFLMSRLDPRLLVSGGIAWIAATTLVRTTWTTDADFWTLSILQLVQGLGVTFMMLPLMSLTLNTVDDNEVASAAGLQSFMRTIATAVATSITLSYWADTQRLARSDAVGAMQPEAVQDSLTGLGFPPDQVRQILSNMVDLEATTLALIHTFWATSAILLFAAALIWLAPRPTRSGGMPLGH